MFCFFFSFFEDAIDEIAASEYALIEFFFMAASPRRKDLRPTAFASYQPAARKFRQPSLAEAFLHKATIFVHCLTPGRSKLEQCTINIHPGMLRLSDDRPVA